MCGIAGEVNWSGDSLVEPTRLLSTLRHRGPDAEGAFESEKAWVGQTRLSIIDLPTGDPPITNETGSLGVALNGEIYNYRELTAELTGRGHRFATKGDTEVIAHLAEELPGGELARRLDGMYAVAVWDSVAERLTLIRDRFGEKPLYYWRDARRLVFASEIKALLAHPSVTARVRHEAIPDYLTFGYVPTPLTFFEGIRSVPPAHVLTVDLAGKVEIAPYWSLRSQPRRDAQNRNGATLDLHGAARRVRVGLREAVERRLVADVPLGAFLSGGIDSSAVVGLMREAGHDHLATFTIGFDTAGFDEREYAGMLARHYGTDHTEFVVRPDAAELIEELVWHHDQPFGDSSALPTYLLSRETSRHVKVALSGDGGDEIFVGYERLAAARALATYQRMPGLIRNPVSALADTLPDLGSTRPLLGKARRALRRSNLPPQEALLAWISYVGAEERSALVADGAGIGRRRYTELWEASRDADPLDRILRLNIDTYLVDDLLPKVDRMSMAHGLEVRAPFLDHHLAELAFALPPRVRLRGRRLKRVLKAAVADLLPPELLARPKKGFGVPLDRWFREDLRALAADRLTGPESRLAGHVNRGALRALVSAHEDGRANHGHALWTLLTLELFLQRFD
jgi:asparagine synthase (glutamine-hydrolysing)